ncbi:C39 family peptidase [Nocardia sp. GAS34]|uniref:C39 family peptidase n=1 Tax=unclassified Nocardia TaxID=2637762 RepID=UPI003D21580D
MCRQLITETEWAQHDGPALGDRMEWSNRACGMAALRMILLAHGGPAPTVTELCHLGVARDALTPRGWLHTGIADLATEFGVPGHAEPVTVEELPATITRGPLIISVTEQFPVDGRRGGHLVVAHGFDDGADPMILFRDPSAWGQNHRRVPLARLAVSYTGRAITFTNPQPVEVMA